MKIVIINKSDRTGGAAMVSFRLMKAFRDAGIDARMLVVEKLTDSPYVEVAATPSAIRLPFLWERLKIFVANGFNRGSLFKIDTASDGLPLWLHPLVKDADAILINWVNQGMLSLYGVGKLLALGKPVAWTMHDMWCMTGVCHHAGRCRGFERDCHDCLLLGRNALRKSLAKRIWRGKKNLYSMGEGIKFIAVSRWLKEKGEMSSLLADQSVSVIPNAFMPGENVERGERMSGDKVRIGFGAARLDDPVKGFPVLIGMTRYIASVYPELASRLELVTFGGIRNVGLFDGITLPHRHLGMVRGEEPLRKVYENTDIIVSSSSYETLPGTLVEAQAYGCIPVSFNQGGQRDIIDHLSTGYIAGYSEDPEEASRQLGDGVVWAMRQIEDLEESCKIRERMRASVESRFSPAKVVGDYLELLGLKPASDAPSVAENDKSG